MSKVQDLLSRWRAFWDEVVTETRKCNWPERQELVESTVVVIVAVLLLAVFVGVSDKLLVTLLRLLISAG
jgi:preprotein translocase subunit SecE